MEQGATLAAALIAGAAGFIGKIVWDWMDKKGEHNKEKHCEDHACLAKEIQQLRLDWMATNGKHEQALAVIQTDLSYIKRKIDLNGKTS